MVVDSSDHHGRTLQALQKTQDFITCHVAVVLLSLGSHTPRLCNIYGCIRPVDAHSDSVGGMTRIVRVGGASGTVSGPKLC
jgi:hypothetical protein